MTKADGDPDSPKPGESQSRASEPTKSVDPDRLKELIKEAKSLQAAGDTSFVQNVLARLPEDQQELYRKPLLEWLLKASLPSSVYQTNMEDMGNLDSVLTVVSENTVASELRNNDSLNSENDGLDGDAESVADHTEETIAQSEPFESGTALTIDSGPTTPRKVDDKPAPETIGKFKVKRELGRGAFGAVYLGYDDELKRYVAIKVSHNSDPEYQRRLKIEAAKLAQVESQGIVPVYQIGQTDDEQVYLVEKYIQGLSLRDLLRQGPLSPARAAVLTREIALALEPAHLQDILHRDLKPDNILIEQNGWPWIADFGLAISEEEQQGSKRELAGTPPYMSPEQIIGRVDFMDPRSDIWAVGVMFYEMLSGKLPFPARQRKSLVEQICELDPRPLHQRAPGLLTEAMNEVFLRCCAKKASDRYATVRELAADLDRLIEEGLSPINIFGQQTNSHLSEIVDESSQLSRIRSGTVPVQGYSTRSAREPSVEEQTPGHSKKVWASLIGIAATCIVAWFAYANFFRPDASVTVVAENVDPDLMGEDQANGSEQTPWLVALTGKASHRSLQAAVDQAKRGDLIRVMGGVYNEPVLIDKAITIEGESIGSDKSFQCELKSREDSPLRIACEDEEAVIVRNFMISGLGHHADENEFNAVDLAGGSLSLEFCELKTDSFNCIKAREGTSLEISHCDFTESRKFAISTKDHAWFSARGNCTFRGSAIQLVGGDGEIEECKFYGSAGVYVSDTPEQVIVRDCLFEDANEYAISCTNNGIVEANNNRITRCDFGLRVVVTKPDATPGQLTLIGGEFSDCTVAIDVQGGVIRSALASDANRDDQFCKIEGGQYGVGAASITFPEDQTAVGEVELTGVQFESMKVAVLNNQAKIKLKNCEIEKCEIGVNALQGDLEIVGGTIQDCPIGIVIGNQDFWPELTAKCELQSVEFLGCDTAGIVAYSGPVTISECLLREGLIGIRVSGPTSGRSEETILKVGLWESEFQKQSAHGIFAEGRANVELDVATSETLKLGPPARITEPANVEVVSRAR